MGTHTRILKKYNRRCSKRYSKKSKRHTRKNIYSKTYKKIQKGGLFCREEKAELERTKTKLQIAKNELDEVRGKNKTLIADYNRLNSEKYYLVMELDKLKEKLKEQTSPTDEEIEAVILDENDHTKIDDTLNDYFRRYADSSLASSGDFNQELTDYKKNKIESVTKEYKIKKLMENRRA